MLKKIFSTENITTFVLVAIACGFALVITPKVFAWFQKPASPPASS